MRSSFITPSDRRWVLQFLGGEAVMTRRGRKLIAAYMRSKRRIEADLVLMEELLRAHKRQNTHRLGKTGAGLRLVGTTARRKLAR
jgi:hypothetical protein